VVQMPLSPRRVQKVPPQALYFDGVDDYVDIEPFPLSGEATVMALFYDMDIYSYYGGTVFSWHYNNNNVIILNHYSTSGAQKLEFKLSGIDYYTVSSTTIPPRFVHATGVLSTSNGFASLYWDGSLVGKVTFTPFTQPAMTPQFARIGTYQLGNWFKGYIAQVLIYSRALSADEILWNYNYPDNPVRNGLVLWLHWDSIDTTKGIWYDKSGYGNHGTIYGATLVQIVKSPKRVQSPLRVLAPVR